ncbi:hypothetical protein ACLB2K_033617 [Fragaria x ananassa]
MASLKRRRAGMRVILPQPHMIFHFTKPQDFDHLGDDDVVGDSYVESDACSETSPDHNPCKKDNHSQSQPEQNRKSSNNSSGSAKISYFDCNLCFKSERQPVVTACGHLFCHSCLCDWLEFRRKCPVCEAEVVDGRIFPIYQCSGPRSKYYGTK